VVFPLSGPRLSAFNYRPNCIFTKLNVQKPRAQHQEIAVIPQQQTI